MIATKHYCEFSLTSERYAVVRVPVLRVSATLLAWFQSVYQPAFDEPAESAWEELPRIFARAVLVRALREQHGHGRGDLLEWLARRIAGGDGQEELLLREACHDAERGLLVVLRRRETTRSLWSPPAPPPPALVRLGPERNRFAVRWVDELGQGIAGVPLTFEHAGVSERQATDPAGVGCVRDSSSSSARVRVADEAKLREALKARWSSSRPSQPWLISKDALVVALRDGPLPAVDLVPNVSRLVSVQPYVARARLIGGFFDTSKCFLLPAGLSGARAVVGMYEQHANAKLLVVGHTDSAGKPDYNDVLSLERATALKDYLSDNADGWLAWYGDDVASEKRWGAPEDRAMIDALPDAASRPKNEHPVRWFQRTRGLSVDGIAGHETRAALVRAYMDLDGTSLPEGIEVSVHGCGENFPQQKSSDGKAEPENRRVEVFFFAGALGVQPAPPGDNSRPGAREYPEWARRSQRTEDHALGMGFKIRLVSSDGLPVPEAAFEVRFSDGSTQRGTLDAHGAALVNGPAGPYSVEYLDHQDIRAKALAARAHKAVQGLDKELLLGVLSQPAGELARVSEAYDTYFNTSGQGLSADARQALGEGDDATAGDHLLAAAGIEPESGAVVVAYNDPSLDPATGGEPAQGGVLA